MFPIHPLRPPPSPYLDLPFQTASEMSENVVYHTRWFKGQAWKWLLEPSYMAPTQWKERLEKIIFLCILEKINWIFQDAEHLLTSSTQIDPESRGQQSMVCRPYPSQRPLLFTHELRTCFFFYTLKRFFTTNKK